MVLESGLKRLSIIDGLFFFPCFVLLLPMAGDTSPPPVASLAHDLRSGESAAFAKYVPPPESCFLF